MKTLIAISILASAVVSNADVYKPVYPKELYASDVDQFAILNARRQFQKEKNEHAYHKQAKTTPADKPVQLTAESLFAAKMAESHGAAK